MSPLSRVAVLLAVLAAFPAAAAADGVYAGLGVGRGAGLEGDYGQAFSSDGHASGRIFGGYRFGPWGVEAAYFGTGMTRKANDSDYSISAVGLSGKYHLKLGPGIELYVRLGLDRTSLAVPTLADGTRPYHDFGGMGIDYGTGVTWQSRPMGTGRVRPRIGAFLDLGVHRTTISREGVQREFGGSMETIQLGFLSSVDF